jgi:LmbE family N-acetylglucosaminyl deacetylase
MDKSSDVLVIMAHPDDAEFGVAGMVAQWTGEGRRVAYVVCTSGEKGTTDRDVSPEDLAKQREQEQLDAAQVLGVWDVSFLRYPDQGLEDTPQFRKEIVRMIRKYRPGTVVTSDPYRRYIWHRDHRIVGQVVLDAVYPFARDHLAYPDLIEEGIEPHKVKELLFWGAEKPNCRMDVTASFEQKMKALHCHESQMKEMGSRDVDKWLRNHCREMAAGEDFDCAEAFYRVEIPQ